MPEQPPKHYDRLLTNTLREKLSFFPIVQVVGPRQSGKTTLMLNLAREEGYNYFSLEDPSVMEDLKADSQHFLENHPRTIIDEAQLYPEITGLLQNIVDNLKEPFGQYVLTGSFDLTLSPRSKNSLAGRICTLELLPLAQAEFHGTKPNLLEDLFKEGIEFSPTHKTKESEIYDMLLQGGYPKLALIEEPKKRLSWLRSYAKALHQQDITPFGRIRVAHDPFQVLQKLARFATQKINVNHVANELNFDTRTVKNLVALYEDLYIIKMIPSFHSKTSLSFGSSQLQFIDSGLFALLQGTDLAALKRNRVLLGKLLETFVFGELAKLCNSIDEGHEISHWRHNHEVDFVLRQHGGLVVGIEIKASRKLLHLIPKGLRELQEHCGKNMINGIVLYLGDEYINMGNGMHQVPMSYLWSEDVLELFKIKD